MVKTKSVTLNNNKETLSSRQELVKHFRGNREQLRRQWVQQMTGKKFLEGLTKTEIETESATIYDTCVKCLETGDYEGAILYAKRMAERGVLQGMTTEQIISGLLVLRDIYSRSLLERCKKVNKCVSTILSDSLDNYEPVANKILTLVAMSFVEEREKIVKQQQQALMELSTPVLTLREHLLILPIIGVVDSQRAKQLTEQLLHSIRENRAKVVVMDITGVPNVDSKVANHLVQTIEAARLLGATVLVTGLSPVIAQTLVTIGVDLSKMKTISDLQSGIDEADRFLGYQVVYPEQMAKRK